MFRVVQLAWHSLRRGFRTTRRQQSGSLSRIAQILLLAAGLLLVCGYLRPPEVDERIVNGLNHLARWVAELVRAAVIKRWLAQVVIVTLGFLAFALLAMLSAHLLSRLPGLIAHLILQEFHRRQGLHFAGLGLVLVYSLPMAATACVLCHGTIALFAWAYVVATFGLIRFSINIPKSEAVLNFHARFRSGLSYNPMPTDDHDAPIDAVEETDEPAEES